MSKKRVTIDEKRARILEIFYDSQEFYNLKEIETIASKEKGVVLQSVKDVLQALVDDGFVKTEKVGSANYFWAFPGEKITILKQKCAELNTSNIESKLELEKLQFEIKTNQVGKEDTEERRKLLEELENLQQKEDKTKQLVMQFSDNDPEVIAKIAKRAEEYKAAANVWTDNIFAIQSWCKNKFDINEETLNKQFRIPEDLDYVQ
ncbi:hypothetical protein HCN44_008068 [Aphidius gifuensis]|uniref:Meiotic nuclear division protein 1 homolog n=1 Tax=Aphidius gifuensis TaxID=684658 RepID=A0A834XQ72_APHGI|nr:meiotic nuclear division protein 1 homolog [Aphidius gifuensis]XP_044016028.1 meiotic nuclear division protein 1 homolog [Aphidius gifuensis]KAF7989394.1 hypothetical protein HCN44_008068 [Aphidius gifuensis]